MGGILVLLHGCIDIKGTVLDKMHYLLYYLAPAMNPRYLSLIDAVTGASVSASVRVGMAVETVGQAGRPKTITGFQVCSFVQFFTPIIPSVMVATVIVCNSSDPYDTRVAGI